MSKVEIELSGVCSGLVEVVRFLAKGNSRKLCLSTDVHCAKRKMKLIMMLGGNVRFC